MASIHKTAKMLGFAMYDLVENQQYMPILWEEIKKVYYEEGKWKESMRLHAHNLVNMPRVANKDITLSNSVFISKDTYLSMGLVLVKVASIFPNPDKFDGHRFLNLRNAPRDENKHQFGKTTPEMTVFSYGHHAFLRRFFSSNKLKLLLSHLVMYYDWKLPEGQTKVDPTFNGMGASPNSRQKMLWKSRKPEVGLE